MSAVQLYMGDDHPLTLDSVRVMETAREKWITSVSERGREREMRGREGLRGREILNKYL